MNNTIINGYPSKCWTCNLARATWSPKLEEDGYVGCTYLLDKWLIDKDIDERTEEDLNDFAKFSEMGEAGLGWISQSQPFSHPRKRAFFNNQILVRGCFL